jgi:hypothetical protein
MFGSFHEKCEHVLIADHGLLLGGKDSRVS